MRVLSYLLERGVVIFSHIVKFLWSCSVVFPLFVEGFPRKSGVSFYCFSHLLF